MQDIDTLFVAKKPIFISTNNFMQKLRKKYEIKKCGFSGTLDPFASGNVIVATGKYTRLFDYLNSSPKVYRATMFLGAFSKGMDIEDISEVKEMEKFDINHLNKVIASFSGEVEYVPPKFSAKRVAGRRAYMLARENIDFDIAPTTMYVYSIKLISYNHPFVNIELSVSKGGYVRSLCELIAKKLGVNASLSSLTRLREGKFVYNNGYALDPLEYMDLQVVSYYGQEDDLDKGVKLSRDKFDKNLPEGLYIIKCGSFFAIVRVDDKEVKYIINKVSYAYTVKEGRRKYSYR